MPKEYIERDAARNALYQYLIEQTESKYPSRELCIAARSGVSEAMAVLEDVSAADVAPVVHGEWILKHIGAGHFWECSVCHTNPCIYVTENTKFCPNCGAKMDGDSPC